MVSLIHWVEFYLYLPIVIYIFLENTLFVEKEAFSKNKQEADWLEGKCPSFCFLPMGLAVCSGTLCLCSVSLLSPHNSTGSSLQFLLKDCCLVQSYSVLFKKNPKVGFYSFRNKSAAFWDLKTNYAAALQGLYLLLLPAKI